jgi:hypothetical protein
VEIKMDDDVRRIAEIMQISVAPEKLVGVAIALAAVAPALWAQYGESEVSALTLISEPISLSGHNKQPTSNG